MSRILVSDLAALASETKRKHPDVRAACDAALTVLKRDSDHALTLAANDPGPAVDNILLRPILLACETKMPKALPLGVALLQRVISMNAVPEPSLPIIINLLTPLSQRASDVDVQLKLLQTVAALLSTYPQIHDEQLADLLRLCFAYQESAKVAVVSSTAAATLRSAVMTICDKVVDEDRTLDAIAGGGEDAAASAPLSAMTLPLPGYTEPVTLFPCSKDAYLVFSNLHHLATGEPHKATFLALPHSPRITFSLELLESVFVNHAPLFRSSAPATHRPQSAHHPELQMVLKQMTCPLLITALSSSYGVEHAAGGLAFSIQVRLMRLLFLLLQKFTPELDVEAEVLMSILLRLLPRSSSGGTAEAGGSNSTSSSSGAPAALPWQRILGLEIIRSLTTDAELLRHLWARYDDPNAHGDDIRRSGQCGEDGGGGDRIDGPPAGLVAKMVEELRRVVTEDSSLIDRRIVREQLGTAPVEPTAAGRSSEKAAAGGAAAFYEAAAGAVSGVLGSGSGSGSSSSSLSIGTIPNVQVIDQLDKADAPSAAPAYTYVLALYALINVATCVTNQVLPAYSAFVNSRPKTASRAPPVLDIDAMPSSTPSSPSPFSDAVHSDNSNGHSKAAIRATKRVVQTIWPAMLASFEFVLSTKCDDAVFAEALAAWRNVTNVAGVFALVEPRDALLHALIKFAVPAGIVAAALDQRRSSTSATTAAAAAAGSGAGPPPSLSMPGAETLAGSTNGATCVGLSRRIMASLKALIHCIYYLSGSLDEFWYPALNALVQAEYVLHKMRRSLSSASGFRPAAPPPAPPASPFAVAPVEQQSGIPLVLVDLTPDELLADISHIVQNTAALDQASLTQFLACACQLSAQVAGLPPQDKASKAPRDASLRLAQSKTALLDPKGNSIILTHIAIAWALNAERLTIGAQGAGWSVVVQHIFAVLEYEEAQPNVRMQAAASLNSITLDAMAACAKQQHAEARMRIQQQVFEAIERQAILHHRRSSVFDLEIRRLAMETMLKVLENYGHVLQHGWDSIFACCKAACDQAQVKKGALGTAPRSAVPLIKIAFAVVQLVASDLLTCLSEDQLRACIDNFSDFALQSEDVNVSLTAVGGLWGVTADVMRRSQEQAHSATELWMHLLQRTADMCLDARSDIRNAAISALFRVLEQYGSSFDSTLWQSTLLKNLYPLQKALAEGQEAAERAGTADQADDKWKEILGEAQSEWKQRVVSRSLSIARLGKVFAEYLPTKIISCPDFGGIWAQLMQLLDETFRAGPTNLSQAAIEAKVTVLNAEVAYENDQAEARHHAAHGVAWRHWVGLTSDARCVDNMPYLSQKNMVGNVNVASAIYKRTAHEFDVGRLRTLFDGLKALLTFPSAVDAPRDVDALTPLQAAVRELMLSITPVLGSRALVLTELAQLSTLAVVNDDETNFTFVALCKTSLQDMQRLYEQWHQEVEVYTDGALSAMLAALAIPMQLRYGCPSSSSNGTLPPLWKIVTVVACRILSLAIVRLNTNQSLPQEGFTDCWVHIVALLEAALSPRVISDTSQNYVQLQEDQVFDLLLLSTIERSVLNAIGTERTPDAIIDRLAQALVTASELFVRDHLGLDEAGGRLRSDGDGGTSGHKAKQLGTWKRPAGLTVPIKPTPRELTAYWTLDLLFLACSRGSKLDAQRERVSSRLLPLLLDRCKSTLQTYAADSLLHGTSPLPRIRSEELNYLLSRLLDLRSPPGAIESYVSVSHLSSNIMQSERVHLLPLFSCLTDLLALPRSTSDYLDKISIGTSTALAVPITLPEGFELGTVGATKNVLHSNRMEWDEPTMYDELSKKCLAAIAGALGLP
ncbi:hypothetical protein K437DRAFT_230880 [Tilletiaria anomala UBC 951]|uniref:Protein MON2 homolog n=1 Tax=Tilletiaria anomala (strain ATCC 24038 / CBS 436.72 / UBC 951) TaxID=1037660 RepID=A0A066WHD1_TILAU|nr:uncharacterized protein K437DRAFT_230880 [Tilletiaria anomala UBC 951]KDN53231.1 hypothetical protein K437DRAFT_230880 [Tilletiaria anomala UBC 951]